MDALAKLAELEAQAQREAEMLEQSVEASTETVEEMRRREAEVHQSVERKRKRKLQAQLAVSAQEAENAAASAKTRLDNLVAELREQRYQTFRANYAEIDDGDVRALFAEREKTMESVRPEPGSALHAAHQAYIEAQNAAKRGTARADKTHAANGSEPVAKKARAPRPGKGSAADRAAIIVAKQKAGIQWEVENEAEENAMYGPRGEDEDYVDDGFVVKDEDSDESGSEESEYVGDDDDDDEEGDEEDEDEDEDESDLDHGQQDSRETFIKKTMLRIQKQFARIQHDQTGGFMATMRRQYVRFWLDGGDMDPDKIEILARYQLLGKSEYAALKDAYESASASSAVDPYKAVMKLLRSE